MFFKRVIGYIITKTRAREGIDISKVLETGRDVVIFITRARSKTVLKVDYS